MKRLLAIASLLVVGCGTATSGPDNMMTRSPLVGTWMSTGSDVAPLLAHAPFNWTSITATFNADSTYLVLGVDTSGKTTEFKGTFTATQSAVAGIYTIETAQVAPSTATADGIYHVDTNATPNRMQYEVVQTQPTNGITPPTPEGGFGSTVYNGQKISSLIQNYSRQ